MRKQIKRWVYGARGVFRYFDAQVYFPPNSASFLAATEQGIFEQENVRVLTALARPGTVCFDVGGNIGLMALPVLKHQPECRVVSFEPSPGVLPYIIRTQQENGFGDRWEIIPKAAGTRAGKAEFFVSTEAGGLYDGLKNTGRAPVASTSEVTVTTIDTEWKRLGEPPVSIIKIDVEGAELDALNGARDCIARQRPDILLEWNAVNLASYGRQPADLLGFAAEIGYTIFTVPDFTRVEDASMLQLQMLRLENFVLRHVAPAMVKRSLPGDP